MCGRFDVHSAVEIIARIFGIDEVSIDIAPNYNVAPSQDIPIVVREGNKNRLQVCRWGFVPSWAKSLSDGYKMINARAETVADKPSFRKAFRSQRCLVVADGFYEWKKEGTAKKPVYVRLKSREPFGFAGLYTLWTSPEGERICTSTIITTGANDLLKPIHDRMPVITPPAAYARWLDTGITDKEALLEILQPYPSREMEFYDVTPKMNSPKHNSADNIKPV